ncbi:MAG: hypothetical protein VX496_04995, partial [Planctomycetota bacterium]|nr:hypothetical protein [Planctomycetota bacterium]
MSRGALDLPRPSQITSARNTRPITGNRAASSSSTMTACAQTPGGRKPVLNGNFPGAASSCSLLQARTIPPRGPGPLTLTLRL